MIAVEFNPYTIDISDHCESGQKPTDSRPLSRPAVYMTMFKLSVKKLFATGSLYSHRTRSFPHAHLVPTWCLPGAKHADYYQHRYCSELIAACHPRALWAAEVEPSFHCCYNHSQQPFGKVQQQVADADEYHGTDDVVQPLEPRRTEDAATVALTPDRHCWFWVEYPLYRCSLRLAAYRRSRLFVSAATLPLHLRCVSTAATINRTFVASFRHPTNADKCLFTKKISS